MELNIHKCKHIWKLVFICLKCIEVKHFAMHNLELIFSPFKRHLWNNEFGLRIKHQQCGKCQYLYFDGDTELL